MAAQHAGDLLHRLEAGAHDLDAPLVKERAGPVNRSVVPEVVKPFPQQHGADGPQVVLHELPQAGALLARLILSAFQEQPARFREKRLSPALSERADFGAADLIDRLAQVLGDMKAVQNVERVPGFLGDDVEVRLPHVAADERERRGPLSPEPAEKLEQRLGASVLADPQQTLPRRVDLIHEGQEVAAVLPVDLIDADRPIPERST